MKFLFTLLTASLLLSSCVKSDFKKEDKITDCEKKSCTECTSTEFEDPSQIGADITMYEIEKLQYNDRGCVSEGYVKYLKDGITVALVKYWTKEGVTYGCKTLCIDGDCKKEGSTCCSFELECEE